MRKNIFYLLFVLCLIKLYYIADQSVQFSPNLLINSFKQNAGEKSSLGVTADDVIPIRNFLLNKNISEIKLSEEIIKNYEIYYQRIIEFTYPLKIKQNATVLIAHKIEDSQENCELLYLTQNFNIYECK